MSSRILGWLFALLSVILMWQLRLDNRLREFARGLGAESGSFVEAAFADFGVPLMLTLAVVGFNWFYGKVWWRVLLGRNYLAGWWVYSLVAQTKDGVKDTLGFFHILHRQDEVSIDEGQAFWPDAGSLIHRGKWKSETTWIRAGRIRLVYTMKAEARLEGLPTDYEGYLELERSRRMPISGRSCWEGSFNDLKHRGEVRGPVYAERLPSGRFHPDDLKGVLLGNRAALLARAREFLPVVGEHTDERGRQAEVVGVLPSPAT